ncbi:coiled-coil domain-containing protein 144A isoform X2 [Macaca thibetana thibetana]|uniref:coiled-coil domain-containing protein 144A isoform X2 n=1 Tax=Macaca thibetana thibetana TaxID=257877 RepID=UPI0021BCC931|nr:coiled-coil domain-containing protein 144A isoform X2 [Macaca thibetana thibetana]
MASRGGEKRGGSEGSPKPTVSAMRKTPSVGSVRSQEDQLSLSYQGDRWSSDSSWLSDSAGSDSAGSDSAGSDSAGSDSEHVEGALDQPQHDVCLEDPCELHRAARSGDVPGVERVLAPGDPGVNKRDRKESLWHLIPECKMEQSPESLPQNNNPDWHPTNLTVSDKTCQKSKILSVDDQCPSVSPSMPENQSAAKELGQMNLTEQEKMNVSGNGSLHDLCQSQLPENKESKEEQDLELTSEEEQERLKGHENKQPQKMSQEPEMAKDCDREDIPVYSILPHAQKSEEMWIEQGKLEWKNKLKLVTNELKQRFGEIRETYKIPVCPEEEPLLDNSMRKTNVKDIPFNLTNNIPGCVEEDASEVSVSVVFETFPEQNEPSLKSIIHPYFHPYSGSLQHACQSSSKLHLHENKLDCDSDNKPGVEHIFSMDENFSNDAGTKKARNPEEVTVEMKEDQEFDLQMTKNMNQNSDSCSTNNYKSLKPKLENLSSLPPDSYRTSEVYLHEELQQDMQKPKTEVDRVEEMFLALKKENVQLQKEKSQRHSESEPSLQSEDAEDADELLRVLSTDLEFLDLDQISPEEQQISSPARQPSGELQEITHQMPQDELGREKRDLEPESREEGQERRVCDIQSKAGISRQSLMSSTTEDILFQKDESAWVYPLKKTQRGSKSKPSLQSEDAEDADELLRVLSTDLEFLDLDQISPEDQQISSPARQPLKELEEKTDQMPQDELGRERRDLEPESREEGQERRVCDIKSKAGISRQSLMSSTTDDILFQKDESAWVYPLKSQRHSESEPSLQSEDAEDADELLRVLSTDLEFLDLDQISPEEQQISSPARQPSGELQEITHQMPQDELGRERRDLEPESREEGQERRVCDIQSKAGISRPSLMSSTTDDTLFQKDESAWVYPLVEEEVEKQRSNSTELSGNPAHGAAAGNNDDGLNQQFPRKKKKGHDRPADKTSNEKNKVKNQVHPEADFADSVGPSETASEDCELSHSTYENFLLLIEQLGMECKDSVSLSRIQDTFCFYEHLLKLKNNDYEQLTVKIKQTENMVSVLQKELSETKKTELQLELQKIELEKQLYSLRLALKQEKEEKGNAVMLYNKYSERLRLKEEECGKEVEMKQRLKWTLRRLVKELKTVRNNLDLVVQERNDVQKQLSEEQNARILQDQILTSKQKELEIAQKKINSEISHRHKKEKDLLHENCMLQEEIALLRLEIDTVNNQNQQKEKKYFEDIEVVKEKNDNLQKIIKLNEEKLTKTILQYSGQLNDLTAENKILNSELENKKQNQERLEIEMESYRCRLAAALRDCDESQTSRDPKLDFQRTRQEWVHLQDKKKVDMSDLQAKTEILSEKLSNAESKISSLQIQLHNTRDAVERKSLILERLQRDLSQTHCEKKEIEQMYQTEQHKLKKYIAKQESVEERLSQLQSENTLLPQQLDDAHKKANSQEKTISTIQDQFHAFAKNLQAESEKKILSLQEKNKELMDEYNHLQERMHQCEKEKARRKVVMRQLQQEWTDPLKQQPTSEATSRCHINLDETLNSKKKLGQIRSEVDLIEAQETAPLRCLHLDAENEVLQLQQTLFSMKAIRKQCETLQKNKKQLKREVVNLKSYMERNMLECVEAEQHKLLIEEKAKKEIAEKLNEAILTLQKQAAVSQEQLAQLREDNTTSVKTQMELTIKNLESEISRINTSSADFNKTELERYKELYLEEVKVRESLSNELNRTNEKIAEVSAQLTVEKELTRSPFAACSTRPILEPPCAGNLNDSEDLNRKHIPRKKKSAPESMESYLLKMQQKLQNDITREVTAATKCEPEPYVASPPESAYQKNLNQDPVLEATKEYAQILSRKYMI